MPKTKTEVKEKYILTVGRRKESTARVRLYVGKGETTVNGKAISQYFPGATSAALYSRPLTLIEKTGKYYATVVCAGGGNQGQLEATIHGLARGLSKADPEKFKPVMKKNGLLTRDSRTRQRRMVGMGGKSRRKKSSPKR
jgi:small subunit ribosomal protein S9